MDCRLYSFLIYFFSLFFYKIPRAVRRRNGRGRVHAPPHPPVRAVRQRRRGNQREANPQPQEPPLQPAPPVLPPAPVPLQEDVPDPVNVAQARPFQDQITCPKHL